MPILSASAKDSYMELVLAFPLVPIRNEKHLSDAQGVLDDLLQERLDRGGEAYVDVLSDLVSDYEDQHHQIAQASPLELLRHLMGAHSLSQSQICDDIGIGRSTLSQFFSGKRELSKSTAKKLADYFDIELSLLL